jgi:hypothetical protein
MPDCSNQKLYCRDITPGYSILEESVTEKSVIDFRAAKSSLSRATVSVPGHNFTVSGAG